MDSEILIAFLIVAGLLFLAILLSILLGKFPVEYESPEKRAGHQGERMARGIIGEILIPGDVLLCNIDISADGKQTELDNVVINKDGVFIIEVKNYSGILIGEEDDREWIKNKTTYTGNLYQKTVKNPIGQVKRQIFILSTFLKEHAIHVWVEGYVFLIEGNSPVKSDYILGTQKDIDKAIHTGANQLTYEQVDMIEEILMK